ncbi:hypothetical protein, partial [Pseudoflavonifractor phocaeensis]|uniref:hypothetical protein n=1 Tax=Pseudoflavonifractor phocaeensis TaxID=1870988 RepID=UPI00195E7AC3
NGCFQLTKIGVFRLTRNGDYRLTLTTFTIEDSLNQKQIDQLHNATLNFSNNSLETKKLCVTAEIASVTILMGSHQNSKIDNLYIVLGVSSLMVALLFYIVDIFFYYYQDKLREAMITEENKIRLRHGLPLRVFVRKTIMGNKGGCRVFRSIFNGSQIMYWILMAISTAILIAF